MAKDIKYIKIHYLSGIFYSEMKLISLYLFSCSIHTTT